MKTKFLFIYLSGLLICHAQTNSIIKHLKNYEINKAEDLIEELDDSTLKDALFVELNYMKNGGLDKNLINEIDANKKEKVIIENLIIGQYYPLVNNKESKEKAYKHLKEAFENALTKRDTILINASIKKMLFHLFKSGKSYKEFKSYIDYLDGYKKDDIDFFWLYYYSIASKLQYVEVENFNFNDKKRIEKEFERGFALAKHPYLFGKLKNVEGIYYDVFLSNREKALNSYNEAQNSFYLVNYFFAQSNVDKVIYNKAIIYGQKGNVRKVIRTIKRDIKIKDAIHIPEKRVYLMHSYKHLSEAYEKLKMNDSALYYRKRAETIRDSIGSQRHARFMKYYDKKFNTQKIENSLKETTKNKKKLEGVLFSGLLVLGLISVILIFTYFLYKRYRKKSNKLEEEQSETLQKLDELKKIVIKNHIILKDKTKIYIADLLYIKSDDHYLNIFLSDGKNHFVRGKLSQIKEELPPNFIQCHRSYIVNANFIKQVNSNSLILIDKTIIPLSRSYKDKF